MLHKFKQESENYHVFDSECGFIFHLTTVNVTGLDGLPLLTVEHKDTGNTVAVLTGSYNDISEFIKLYLNMSL